MPETEPGDTWRMVVAAGRNRAVGVVAAALRRLDQLLAAVGARAGVQVVTRPARVNVMSLESYQGAGAGPSINDVCKPFGSPCSQLGAIFSTKITLAPLPQLLLGKCHLLGGPAGYWESFRVFIFELTS